MVKNPDGDYLVVVDGEQHLQVKRNGKPDHRLMGAAWAALHSGFRGNKYAGPNKAEAIARLTKLYKSEGLTLPGKAAAAVVAAVAYLEAKKDTKYSEWTDVRDAGLKAGEWHLEVLGAPYGGHVGGKDLQGQYFSPKTDFALNIGDVRPVYYYHGDTPQGARDVMPTAIGKAKATRRDSKGLWFDVTLDKGKELAKRVYDAATRGLARASSGAVNYLTRYGEDGEILSWPIGELTLLDVGEGRMPANQFASVTAKSHGPEALEKAEEASRVRLSAINESDNQQETNDE